MSGFRYGYTASYGTSDVMTDENGQPVVSDSVSFECDYQPTISATTVNYNGSLVNVSAKLYIPLDSDIDFELGSTINVNDIDFTLVSVFTTHLNIELWVK